MKISNNALNVIITGLLAICLSLQAKAQTLAVEKTNAMSNTTSMTNTLSLKDYEALLGQKNVDTLLQESWQAYRTHFIKPDGRVVDPDHQITTSEGQSYALLRSAFMNDQETFDKAWLWTKHHLTRSDGKLFAWLWGTKADGSLGILDQKSATDADEDIALALIIASSSWHRPELRDESRRLLKQIWDVEVITINGKSYLGPGNWAKHMPEPMLNPSYFAPYAYRLFAKLDPEHNWQSVIDTSYDILNQASNFSKLQLPPDWCDLNKTTGKVSLDPNDKNSDYSYDAIRVAWRISLDWQWNKDIRAKKYLGRLSSLQDSWNRKHTVYASYTMAGMPRERTESLAGLGCILPQFAIFVPDMAKQILMERLISQYNHGLWDEKDDYYGQNWAWFGIALMFDKLSTPQVL